MCMQHSKLGLRRDYSCLPGHLTAAQGRVAQSVLIRCYSSPPLCSLCQLDLGQAVGQRVFSLVPVCRHSSSQFILQAKLCRTRAATPHFPHSFRNSGALHKCVPSGETPAKSGEWEGKLQREGKLKGVGPLITAPWGRGRKQKLRVELQSKSKQEGFNEKVPKRK